MKDKSITLKLENRLQIFTTKELRYLAKELNIENYYNLDSKALILEICKIEPIESVYDTLDQFTSLGSNYLIDFWFQSYVKNKILTLTITIIFFLGLISTLVYFSNKSERQITQAKSESENLNKRINDLELVESSLKDLLKFVDYQKQAILQTEERIKDLEQKRDELLPIVKSDQKIVEAIFSAQEKRNRQNRWTERLIGFVSGLVTSIIASIIYGFIKRR
nr:hypothetical protein [uncultured Carboxylicivirga sp.]